MVGLGVFMRTSIPPPSHTLADTVTLGAQRGVRGVTGLFIRTSQPAGFVVRGGRRKL